MNSSEREFWRERSKRHSESDAALRRNFFRNLDAIFYAGAALPQNLWERLEALALAEKGGPGERETLRQVAIDPRTQQGLTAAIKDALAKD